MDFLKSRWRADILFVILGAIPIAVASRIEEAKHALTFDLCKDFGVVIVSLAVVDLLWQLVAGGEPLSREIKEIRDLNGLTRQSHRIGLIDAAERRSELLDEHKSLTELIGRSSARIDISGFTLHILVENQRLLNLLLSKAKQKVAVRILICDPQIAGLAECVQDHVLNGMRAEMETTWTTLLRGLATLAPNEKKYFQIRRLKQKMMSVSVFRVDDMMSVVHYLRSKTTTDTPVFVTTGHGYLFNTYVQRLERFVSQTPVSHSR